jgi:hypothetical protein
MNEWLQSLRSTTGSPFDYPTAASFHIRSWSSFTNHTTIRQRYNNATGYNTNKTRINVNTEARSSNHCCRVKAVSILGVSVASDIRNATRMRHVSLSFLARPALPHSYALSHKGTIFGAGALNTECVLRFYLQILSETFLILRRIQRDIITNVRRSACAVPVSLVTR